VTNDRPATIGVVLAGGLARRMGGIDKSLREVGGRTLLEHVVARLRPQCDGLVLSANGDPARFSSFGLPVIADAIEGHLGPLVGVLSALDWTATHRPDAEWVVSAACDCPFLPRDLVQRFHERRAIEQAQLAFATSKGQQHPVFGLWPVALRGDLRRALVVEDIRKVESWTARYRVVAVSWPAEPLDPFFNANTLADLAEAERLAPRLED
jgi:molybdopterin-guanine dinucleotide biosynthesis protein A